MRLCIVVAVGALAAAAEGFNLRGRKGLQGRSVAFGSEV